VSKRGNPSVKVYYTGRSGGREGGVSERGNPREYEGLFYNCMAIIFRDLINQQENE